MPGKGWLLSHSAPVFTAEDYRNEMKNLTAEEQQLIENELHGRPGFDFVSFETPERVAKALEDLDQIVRNVLPKPTIVAYLEALEKDSEMVQRETNPIMFLRTEHYDVEKAAKRLVTYWKERKELFGPDRAFRRMTLNPTTGALGSCPADMGELQRGHIARLPDDSNGRPVLFLDRSLSTKSPTYDRDSWLRVLWYLITTIAADPDNQVKGYVKVINLKFYEPHTRGDRMGAKKLFIYMKDCWCPRLTGYHAIYSSPQTSVKLFEPAVQQMKGRHVRLRTRHHYGYDSDNVQTLAQYGLMASSLPPAVGGTYTVDMFLEWVQARRNHEEQE